MTVVDCPTCAFADSHGWWGQLGTHCRRCHRSWRSLHQVHCVTCCAHFVSHNACDEHLTPTGCRDPRGARTRDGRSRLELRDTLDGSIWGFAQGRDFARFVERNVTKRPAARGSAAERGVA